MNEHVVPVLDDRAVSSPLRLGRSARSKHELRVGLGALLVVCDGVALFVGFSLANYIRFGTFFRVSPLPIRISLIPIYLLCALAAQAYAGSTFTRLSETLRRGLVSLAAAAGLFLFLIFALQSGDKISRIHLVLDLVFSALFLMALRSWHCRFARRALGGSLFAVITLNDGDYAATDRPGAGAQGVAVDVRRIFDPARPDPASYHELAHVLEGADRVIVRCEADRRELWAHVLRGMNVRGEVLAPEFSDVPVLAIGRFEEMPTLILARGPLDLRDRVLKRGFDLVVATSAVIALAPVMVLTAIAIKLDTPGPILFRQERIGRQNRIFHVLKFRSMYDDARDVGGTVSTRRDDSRVTRVGRFIRKTSIDELPQLFNVLRGEMSVVGPRPHAVHSTAEATLFWKLDERYWHRHALKPGITGLAQVRGHRGATHKQTDLTSRLEADLEYADRWSFWHDVSILIRTVFVVFHRNAY